MLGILGAIYIVSALLSLFLFVCVCAKSTYVFRKMHPSFKFPQMHWTDKVVTAFEVAFLVVTPLLNLGIAVSIVFEFDNLCDMVIRGMEKKHNLAS